MRTTITAVFLAVFTGIATDASAAGLVPFQLPAPPPAGAPASSTLRDALFAVQHAAATNPEAAQNAAFTYNAAIEQYNAHQYDRARASALTAISQSMAPHALVAPVPRAAVAPPFPGPRYYIIPYELPATSANASKYVVFAHRAMASCRAPQAAAEEYRGAVAALSAKNYRVAMADSRDVVDDCTGQ